jgi:3-oxoacyl-[acyl-carrier-protein] synthase-3
MIGSANGAAVSITGLGCHVPERVLTNDELAGMVETSDEWIVERTGIRERRIAAPEEALSDLALPAARTALEQAGLEGSDVDLIIVATVTPDMAFPATAAILAEQLGAREAGAYDLSAGCTGFMYALAQAYGMLAGGLSRRALVVGGDVLSKIMASGETVGEHLHFVKMNGREVFKFATRVLVSSAEAVLEECGREIDEVEVYVPHQANVRIIEYARNKLGIPEDRVVVDVDRYGNTSSGSIPLALADAQAEGRLEPGTLVLMTGMGAGLTWGSALIEWTDGGRG